MSQRTPTGTDLGVTFIPELKAVGSGVSRDFVVMAAVNAPIYKSEVRAPVDLSCVIDRSGSMSGERIKLVQETMNFVVENLQDSDRLGIITYSSSVENHFYLTKMDKAGKASALQSIKGIHTNGQTNLEGGLLQGVSSMRHRNENDKNQVASVMLFTDGQANQGNTTAPGIINNLKTPRLFGAPAFGSNPYSNVQRPKQQKLNSIRVQPSFQAPMQQTLPPMQPSFQAPMQQTLPPMQQMQYVQAPMSQPQLVATPESSDLPCTINTFGFGSDHNADLLKSLADFGQGSYYFIESKNNISEAFADCLGGLLSTVGQNITVKFEAVGPVQIKKLHTKFAVKEIQAGSSYEVTVGDIQSEEEKDLLLTLSLPSPGVAIDASEILKVTLNYFNVVTKKEVSTEIIGTIARPSAPEKEKRDFELDKQMNRVIAADAMETSNSFAQVNNMDQARETISSAISRIKESVSAEDKFCQSLIQDLERCKAGLVSQVEYQQVGSKMLMNQAQAHSKQRSNNVQWAAQACYQTSNRQQMYSNFKSK